jgi:uncharacterized DUF497 family protein
MHNDDTVFEWDEQKAKLNLCKHKVGFEVAVQVFNDPSAVSIQDRIESNEERWKTIGKVNGVTILSVAHTLRLDETEIIRIISARKATYSEKKYYERNEI